jgi:hypothetical protein
VTSRERPFELHRARKHPVVVLISAVDVRIIPALRFVANLPFAEARALHVSVDPEETQRLAHDWMRLGLGWLPLHVADATHDDIAGTVRAVLREEAVDDVGAVTVVVPELDLPRWWHALLHRHSARRIAARLQGVPGLTTVIVPFCLPAAALSGRT